MKAVVTGATSFIGAATVRHLLRQGHEVCAVVRPFSSNLRHLRDCVPEDYRFRLQIVELDMQDIWTLAKKDAAGADVWVHACWEGSGSANRTLQNIQKSNVTASLEAVRTAAVMGCSRFLFTGSQAEYGICHEKIREDTPCNPVSEYGKAKVDFANQARPLCKTLKMEYIHTRIFSVYGPGDHPWSLVQSCLGTWKQSGEMKLGDCTQWWNFLYIEDAASALMHLLERGRSGFYNVASEDTRPLREFVEEMYRLCGSHGSLRYGERPQNAEGAADLLPDITKICGETGWRPETSFAEGIYETMHHLPEASFGAAGI